jgi:squalene synthase HpnC
MAALIAEAPASGPRTAAVMARARTENFPVASRVLPRRVRAHLLAVYGFARLVDELGDADAAGSSAADRLAALDEAERDLDRALEGHAEHPLFERLAPTLRACGLGREPFVRLIDANRMDQRVHRYESWEQLLSYCELSANPVGEIVLRVLGKASAGRIALSDAICTALQLAEHLQDVAEDVAAGRFYVPAEDLARFGASHEDLLEWVAPGSRASVGARAGVVRRDAAPSGISETLAFEVARARSLLDRGTPLIDTLSGRERVAVAAFVAGGRAALQAIEDARYDVRCGAPRAGARQRLTALAATLSRRGGGAEGIDAQRG